MQQLTLPSSVSKGGWRVSPSAFFEALDLLGITWEVVVKTSGGVSRRGAHRTMPKKVGAAGWFHSITVSTYLSPEEATATLWHELTHAAQVEAAPDVFAFAKAYREENARRGYDLNVYEVEARETAETMRDVALTKRA